LFIFVTLNKKGMLSSVFLFLDIGGGELALIMFVALLLFGGDKLPGLARGLGKGIRDFKDASEGVKREINSQIDNFESKKREEEEAAKREETPLIAEHSEDNLDGKAEETPVAHTMPMNETYTATDHVEFEGYHQHDYREDYHRPVGDPEADSNTTTEKTKTT
jgi:sec-independent protein translocase protein TatA